MSTFTASETCYTPTHTTFSPADHENQFTTTSLSLSPPLANEIFIIRQPKTDLAITLQNGNLCLHTLDIGNAKCHWRVIENPNGWLGFRNVHSDMYIRHNNNIKRNWRFVADVPHHSWWECFITRPALEGRHELLVKHWDGFRGMRVGGIEGRELVITEQGERGVAWEFLKVG
ncbi:hypothetical protein AFLA70_588g000450 [Aspergillus flavus AF70]|nr:hypothetical protein AFLA70_588g000450 [Aspergillus flavus AF70]